MYVLVTALKGQSLCSPVCVLITKWSSALMISTCFLYSQRTVSKYLQKNNSPFLFLISMRLILCPLLAVPFEKRFSDRNWEVSVPQGSPCRDNAFRRAVVVSSQLPFRGPAGVTKGLKVVWPGYTGAFAS